MGNILPISLNPGISYLGLIVLNTAGQFYNTATSSFEAYTQGNLADYAIAGTEKGDSGIYHFSFPSVPLGNYWLFMIQQAGASLALGDFPAIGSGLCSWDASKLVGSSNVLLDAGQAIYTVLLEYHENSADQTDGYTAQWFKNDAPLESGCTLPKIKVIDRTDWSERIAETAMAQDGETGRCKYDTINVTQRLPRGRAHYAVLSMTIDGEVRSRVVVVGRDLP